MSRLHLALLGGFRARLESGPVVTVPGRKAQALLAYLALPPGKAHPRDKLANLLWAESSPARADPAPADHLRAAQGHRPR